MVIRAAWAFLVLTVVASELGASKNREDVFCPVVRNDRSEDSRSCPCQKGWTPALDKLKKA